MTYVTCRLTAKNRDQLRNHTLGSRVWATFTFFTLQCFQTRTVTYLPYRVSGSTLSAVWGSQLLARWPGTHSRILSAIQRAAQTVFSVYPLKRTCSRDNSASSALGVLNDYALYKSTHSLTQTSHIGYRAYFHP